MNIYRVYLMLIAAFFLLKGADAQIITHSDGEIEIPNVTSSAGPMGLGSILWFSSGDSNTAIQENWGLNLIGDGPRPIKIYNTSLLVGYTSGGTDYGSNNVYISGSVGIGTTNSQGYKFAVNGKAIATAMTVKLYTAWPDYVFDTNYNLPSLHTIKTFIDQNHHLPGIPTETEVYDSGLNLGEMDKTLVKKVEELTLYLIEKDNEIKSDENRFKTDEKQIKNQQQEIDMLKQQIETINTRLKTQ